MKRLLLAAALTLLAATSATAQTVVLVRHAEKADQSRDPALSDMGQRRAIALTEAVSQFRFDEIIVTSLQRTSQTAAPIARASQLKPTIIPLDGGTPAHVAAVVDRIRTLPEFAKVLVVGHSNTIPLISREFGVAANDMPDCEYDRLTIVMLGDDGSTVINDRYGKPSACE